MESIMQLTVNGKKVELSDNTTVLELLKKKGVPSPDIVTVEVNETILKRQQFEQTVLNENDKVDFLFIMAGGGC